MAARAWASVQASSSSTRAAGPLGRVAGIEVGAAALALGQKLDDEAACAPGASALRQGLADREAHQGRDLLRALEILMRGALEALPFERDDALIARHVAARIDGERDMPSPEQVLAWRGGRDPRLSNRASARRFDGASKSTSSMLTAPSLFVCS